MSHIFETKPQGGFPTEGDGTYNEVFRALPLTHFPKPTSGHVLTLNSETSLTDALKALSDAKILSAPVRDNNQPDTASYANKFLGVTDFNTIVHFMMSKTWGHAPASLEELRTLKNAFKTTTVGQLFAEGSRSPFVVIDEATQGLLDVILYLGKYGVHRVLTASDGQITNILTQTAMLEVIANNLGSFEAITKLPISELGLGLTHAVFSVTLEDSTWEAFRVMHEKNVSAVAVLDEKGAIIGNISAVDVSNKILDPAQFATLSKPISAFFVKGLAINTVKPTDTLEHVIRTFQATRVHRLYVVDGNNKPTGVVALRDVLAQFVRVPLGEVGTSCYIE
jgi:CBS domain-containing protein